MPNVRRNDLPSVTTNRADKVGGSAPEQPVAPPPAQGWAPKPVRRTVAADLPSTPSASSAGLRIGPGYSSLEALSGQLAALDPRFDPSTPRGRACQVLALAIGGTEVFGKDTKGTDFFTRLGGTKNNMVGFAQFNLAFHRKATATPQGYAQFLADIFTGKQATPNSRKKADFAGALLAAVNNGTVKNGISLSKWMKAQGFGGSNWQGIDDGWSRVPGLGASLVRTLKSPQPQLGSV